MSLKEEEEKRKLEIFTIDNKQNQNVYPFTMHGNMLSTSIPQYNQQQFHNNLCFGDVGTTVSKESYPKNFIQDFRANIQVVLAPSYDVQQKRYLENEENNMRACVLYRTLFGFMFGDTQSLDLYIRKIAEHVSQKMTFLPIAIREMIHDTSIDTDITSRLGMLLVFIVACEEIRQLFVQTPDWSTTDTIVGLVSSDYINTIVPDYDGPKIVQTDPNIVRLFFKIVREKYFDYVTKKGDGKNFLLDFVVECLVEYKKIFKITPLHVIANKILHK
jgi:hypothetical protein